MNVLQIKAIKRVLTIAEARKIDFSKEDHLAVATVSALLDHHWHKVKEEQEDQD